MSGGNKNCWSRSTRRYDFATPHDHRRTHSQPSTTRDSATGSEAPGSGYRLVYLVFNTIHNLLTQDDQVRCFENASRHLADGGVFVVEASAPGTWLRGRQFIDAEYVGNDAVVLDVNRYDPVTQILDENHVHLSSNGVRLGPISQRVAFPSELDLMARIAGRPVADRRCGPSG